jgi:hypothetical protein
MDLDELLVVLKKINSENGSPVDGKILEQIIALVVKNPLEEDRARCQDQISEIIAQYVGATKNDH